MRRPSRHPLKRRVSEHLGMTQIADDRAHPWIVRTVMGMTVEQSGQSAS